MAREIEQIFIWGYFLGYIPADSVKFDLFTGVVQGEYRFCDLEGCFAHVSRKAMDETNPWFWDGFFGQKQINFSFPTCSG